MFFYRDKDPTDEPYKYYGRPLNHTKLAIHHYGNLLFLQFVLNNSNDRVERHQANKEISICERKIDFHRSRPTFNYQEFISHVSELKKTWQSKRYNKGTTK
jgi:hypothetical protein